MNAYMKVSFVVAAVAAVLTFAVSIPVNLLGTSLIRSGGSFIFFVLVTLGARWVFLLIGSQKKAPKSEEQDDLVAGQQIDLRTPEDRIPFDDLFSSVADASEQETSFEPLSAPHVTPGPLADVARQKPLDNETHH